MSRIGNRKANRKNRQRDRRTRLSVQALESRKLLAGDIGITDGMIAINGTDANDVAEVYVHDDSVSVSLTTQNEDGTTQETSETFQQSEVEGIVFDARGGDDLLINDTSFDSIMRAGSGNDTVMGGQGNDILVAGSGDDVVLGGGGDDVILGGPGVNLEITPAEQPVAETPTEPVAETPADSVADETSTDEFGEESDGETIPVDDIASEDTQPESDAAPVVDVVADAEPDADPAEELDPDPTAAEDVAETEVGPLAIEDSLEPLTEEDSSEEQLVESDPIQDGAQDPEDTPVAVDEAGAISADVIEEVDLGEEMESCSGDFDAADSTPEPSVSGDEGEMTEAVAAELLAELDPTADADPVQESEVDPTAEEIEGDGTVLADPVTLRSRTLRSWS